MPSELIRDAIRYWEIGRLWYNLALTALAGAWLWLTWPQTRHPTIGIPLALSLLAAGCGPEAQVSASAYLAPPLTVDMLTVTIQDGQRAWEWHGPVATLSGSFGAGTPSATPSSTENHDLQGIPSHRWQLRLTCVALR